MPLADFTLDASNGDVPHPVNFDASNSSDIDGSVTAYTWDFGDGNTASGQIASHSYTTAGTFDVVLTVTDDLGDQGVSTAQQVTVIANAVPTTSFTASTTSGEIQLSVNLDASASTDSDGTITTYAWDFGDGNTATGVTSSHTYTIPGSYNAVLTLTDNGGAQTVSAAQVITALANTPPVSTFTVNTDTGDIPLNINFDASTSSDVNGGITSYDWTFGDGNTASGVTTSHSYTTQGVYWAFLTVTDDEGDATVSSSRLIIALPASIAPTASFSASTTAGDTPLTVNFNAGASTDYDGTITAYNWNFGDGNTGTGVTPTHTYTTAGIFSATVTVTDDDGDQTTSAAQTITANTAPTSSFTVDVDAGDSPLAVTFTSTAADSDGTIASYAWNFGDGNSSTATNPVHTYTTAGVYWAFLTVTDNIGGVTISSSRLISVVPANVAPTASFSASTTSGDAPLTVNFNAGASADSDGTITTYDWDFGDSNTGTGQTPTHTYTTVGAFSVTVTVTDDDAAQTTSAAQTITTLTPNVAPASSFTVDVNTGANPLTVSFTSTSTDSDGTIASYAWDFGDSNSGTGATTTHTYTTNGIYLASLTVTDDDGDTDISTAETIRVLPPNVSPVAAFTTDVSGGIAPLTVNFDASTSGDSDGSIVSYVWDYGDGNFDTGQTTTHIYTGVGTFTATLTITDSDGAQDTTSTSITTTAGNAAPIAVFSVDTDTGVAPLTVNFDGTASSDPDGSITAYAWDLDDAATATTVTTSHTYNTPGTYTVTFSVTDNGGLIDPAVPRTITVLAANTLPTAAFTEDVTSGTSPVTVNFDASTSTDADGTIASYEWDFGDGFTASGQTVAHTYHLDGSHTTTLTITDDRGGQNTANQTITVTNNGGVSVSGNLSLSGVPLLDSDINDMNSAYTSNNTTGTAQALPSPTSITSVWGFVTKDATGVAGQRFENTSDEVDMYSASLAAGQTINLTIQNHTDDSGLENGNDLDLYLYSVSDTQTPVASSLSTNSTESVSVPTGDDYYIVVSAYRGKSMYQLQTVLLATSLNKTSTLSLTDDMMEEQVVAKMKPEVVQPQGMGAAQRSAHAITQLNALGSRNNISMLRGHANRASLFAINPPAQNMKINQGPQTPTEDTDSLFDGRYGIGLNNKDRKALKTIKAIKALRKDSSIEYAEPNYIQKANLVPDDVNYSFQWHYPAINLPTAWDLSIGSSSVIVAVIDTGVFMSHEDLAGNVLSTGYDFIVSTSISNDGDGIDADPDDPGDKATLSLSSWHGTHVTGTIAADSNNTTGVTGVAHDIRVMPIRALGIGGGSSYDIGQSVLYAAGLSNDSGTTPAQAADIINMSLGGTGFSQSQANAVEAAQASGVIVIASAGNDDSNGVHYPSDLPGVVSVGAVGLGNAKAAYSNYGPNIDLVAPGGDSSIDADTDGKLDSTILSTHVDTSSGSRQSGYDTKQGTSMASPHVAGVVALMKSEYAALTPNILNALIQNGDLTTDLSADGASTRNDIFGYGMIDANKSVLRAQALDGGASLPSVDEATIINGVDSMVVSTVQTINITRQSGTFAVASTSVNYPVWATLAPSSVDANGMGDYQLTIDRSGLAEGLYLLDITFTMDNTDTYTTQVSVSVQATVSPMVGTTYLALLDNATRNMVVQTQVTLNTTSVAFSLSNVPNGTYVLFAGTDFDGDRTLEADEFFGAVGGTGTPTIITVSGSNITGLTPSIGSTTGTPVPLTD